MSGLKSSEGSADSSNVALKYMDETTSDEYIQEGVRFMMDLAAAAWDIDSDGSESSFLTARSESMVPEADVGESGIKPDLVMFESNNASIGSNDVATIIQSGLKLSEPNATEPQTKPDDTMSESSNTISDTTLIGDKLSRAVSEANTGVGASEYTADDEMSDSNCTVKDGNFGGTESSSVQSEANEDIFMVNADVPDLSGPNEEFNMLGVTVHEVNKRASEAKFSSDLNIDGSDTNTIKAEPMSRLAEAMKENKELTDDELAIAENRGANSRPLAKVMGANKELTDEKLPTSEHDKEAAANSKPSFRKREHTTNYREKFHGYQSTAGSSFWSQIKKNPKDWLNYVEPDNQKPSLMAKESVEGKQEELQAEATKQTAAESKKAQDGTRVALGGAKDYEEDADDELSPALRGFLSSKAKIKEGRRDDRLAPGLSGFKEPKVKIKKELGN